MSSPCRHFYTSEGLSSSHVRAADLLFLYTSACLRRFASLDMLPPIRTPAPLSAAPCSLGGVSEGLSSSPVQAAVLLILPHVFAASRLSTCCPQFALPRRSAPLPAHWGAYRKVSPPPTCQHVEEERLSDTGSIIMPFPEGGVKWGAALFLLHGMLELVGDIVYNSRRCKRLQTVSRQ